MLGNFTFYNPTKLYFGENSLDFLKEELKNYGDRVLLVYGSGSIKKIGLYDKVVNILKDCDKLIFEDPNVMPNPTVKKLHEGIKIARENSVDLIIAVGGGSCCDYAKALSASIYLDEEPWEYYFLNNGKVNNKIVPLCCILTMVGTGSEMNGGSVITNEEQKLKLGHLFETSVFPKFSILDPTITYSLPKYQMVAGIYDIFCHICEQYFSGEDDSTSDYLSEGLMLSLINSSRIAIKNPTDYEARSNIMWTSTMALNTMLSRGKSTDWMVHMLGQSIGAYTDATHGMTLSSVSIPYYNLILPYGLKKFVRFAKNVWKVDASNKDDLDIAREGLSKLSEWMNELGLVMKISELGVTADMIDEIARKVIILNGGYHRLSLDEIIKILNESM